MDDYDTIKELLENGTRIEIYTGGKRYTGGISGLGHSWTLNGVNVYGEYRKKLVMEVKNIQASISVVIRKNKTLVWLKI